MPQVSGVRCRGGSALAATALTSSSPVIAKAFGLFLHSMSHPGKGWLKARQTLLHVSSRGEGATDPTQRNHLQIL